MEKTIKELKDLVDQRIGEAHFGASPPELYEPIHYIMSLGGKRMRPLLLLLGYSLFREQKDEVVDIALAIEAFHNFTLMHDDIMDEAPIRRGKATVHERWNESTAILSGDVMLVKVYQLLTDKIANPEKLVKVLQAFNKCAAEVCEGQQIDMLFESREDVSEAQYLEMIRLKTAVLLGASLKIGAILADAEEEEAEKLYQFGEKIGLGFQLMDDILDAFGDQEKFGKQKGGDIISNKKTFLLIKARDLASGDSKAELEKWLDLETFDPDEKVTAVLALYEKLGIKELAEGKMREFFDQGFEQLQAVQGKSEYKEILFSFTQKLAKRVS